MVSTTVKIPLVELFDRVDTRRRAALARKIIHELERPLGKLCAQPYIRHAIGIGNDQSVQAGADDRAAAQDFVSNHLHITERVDDLIPLVRDVLPNLKAMRDNPDLAFEMLQRALVEIPWQEQGGVAIDFWTGDPALEEEVSRERAAHRVDVKVSVVVSGVLLLWRVGAYTSAPDVRTVRAIVKPRADGEQGDIAAEVAHKRVPQAEQTAYNIG